MATILMINAMVMVSTSGHQEQFSLVILLKTPEKDLEPTLLQVEKNMRYCKFLHLSILYTGVLLYQGNYYDDIRHGEGVVSYPCGRQDVGIWRGHHLVELKYPLVEAYFQPNRASDRESLKSPDYTLRGLVSPRGYLEVIN